MIRPAFGPRAKAVMARSISLASRTPTGVNSTLNEGATVWIAARPPEPAGTEGARITAIRFIPGASSLSSSSHLPLILNSYEANPVAFVPGRDRLSTQPPPTGSIVDTNTIGTLPAETRPRSTRPKPRRHPAKARPTPQRICENDQDRLRPSGIRSARYGRRSSPVRPAPAQTP